MLSIYIICNFFIFFFFLVDDTEVQIEEKRKILLQRPFRIVFNNKIRNMNLEDRPKTLQNINILYRSFWTPLMHVANIIHNISENGIDFVRCIYIICRIYRYTLTNEDLPLAIARFGHSFNNGLKIWGRCVYWPEDTNNEYRNKTCHSGLVSNSCKLMPWRIFRTFAIAHHEDHRTFCS